MYVIARPLLDHTMPRSKLHSTVRWKGTAQFPSSCSFTRVAVVFLRVGAAAARCTPAMFSLMSAKVLCEQGASQLFGGGLTLVFL